MVKLREYVTPKLHKRQEIERKLKSNYIQREQIFHLTAQIE